MKTLLLKFTFLIILSLLFIRCKKEKEEETIDVRNIQNISEDEVLMAQHTNDIYNDVTVVLSQSEAKLLTSLPCNAQIDSITENDTLKITINYDGTNCNGEIYRKGQVIIKKRIDEHWKNSGAKVIVIFNELNIRKINKNKTFILNGVTIYENVSGGLLVQLHQNLISQIIHKISGHLNITFENGKTKIWNIAKKKTFSNDSTLSKSPGLVITLDGFGTEGSYTNLIFWGINRNGEKFYSKVKNSIIRKEVCSFKPISGQIIHDVPSDEITITITYGFNDNNQPVSNNECPTKFKVEWRKGSKSGTIFISL